jgi:hypothetical protein
LDNAILPRNSDEALSITAHALPAYSSHIRRHNLVDESHLRSTDLLIASGKTQSAVSRMVNNVRDGRVWPKPIIPLLMFAVSNVKRMVKSSLPHCGLFP